MSKLTTPFLPRQLRHQLAWLTSLVLLLTIFLYAWYSASEQSTFAQNRAELEVVALAQNVAVTSTDAIVMKDFAGMESLLVRALTLPHTLEVRITNAQGRLLSHVVRKPGGQAGSPVWRADNRHAFSHECCHPHRLQPAR